MSEFDEGTDLVLTDDDRVVRRTMTNEQIEALGFLMPIAEPKVLREAMRQKQQIMTSLLDPDNDFLYTVSYMDSAGKPRNHFFTTLEEAKKARASIPKSKLTAHPRKSGCIKLALALGIQSKEVRTAGLPLDQKAPYSSSHFIATHTRTGRQEEGQGYCDRLEKPGLQNFAIISMANTRAYCHAVLRCAGFDNVGADEMDFDEPESVVLTYNDVPLRERALPETTAKTVDLPVAQVARETVAAPSQVTREAEQKADSATAATERAKQPPSTSTATSGESAKSPGKGDLITTAMAQLLSEKLLRAHGERQKAQAWLLENAGVNRSIHVCMEQNGALHTALDAIIAELETK